MLLHIPLERLPLDEEEREQLLLDYFAERVAESSRNGHEWLLRITPPPSPDYYPDPLVRDGLAWWDPNLQVAEVPYVWRQMGSWQLSLNDAWTIRAWSAWLAERQTLPSELVLLHVDDHDDLMTPRLGITESGFVDLVSGAFVELRDEPSVTAAIMSGAIGQGSFVAPLVHAVERVTIRHLCCTSYADTRQGIWTLEAAGMPDNLLSLGAERPSVRLVPSAEGPSTYQVTRDPEEWTADLPPGHVFLHVDFDYFNNRYNGDSDWRGRETLHDPPIDVVLARMTDMIDAVMRCDRRIDVASGALSPGFFPAEMWPSSVATFGDHMDSLVGNQLRPQDTPRGGRLSQGPHQP